MSQVEKISEPLEVIDRLCFIEKQIYDLIKIISLVLKYLVEDQSESVEYLNLITEKEVSDNIPDLAKSVMNLAFKIEKSLLEILDEIFEPFLTQSTSSKIIAVENTVDSQMKLYMSYWRLSLIANKIKTVLNNIQT